MTRPFRCSRLGWERQKPDDCGRMYETIGQRETRHHQRCGSPIHRIARGNIPKRI